MYKKRHPLRFALRICLCMMAGLCLCGCSTKKNTAGTRFYHATTARFNTFYNGQVAFDEGVEAQYKGHKEDYTRLLPMYVSTNKSTQAMGKANFETAITKCEKAIKVHSIKKKPVTKGNKKRTPQEKLYLARKEFNPFLYRAWLLMAQSQFQQGNFIECASTCHYILRLYATQPEVTNVARALLARCYVALEWPYDAEDVLQKMSRDSLTPHALREKEQSQAAYFISTGQYEKAIPYLSRSIRHVKGKLPRTRLKFLLGQLYQRAGNNEMAYKSFSRVIRSNPPYELACSARIMQTEVVAAGKSRQTISRLRRMLKDDKNKNYLDQIYYAIGNIYLSQADTARCIGAYEKGAEESKGNPIAKAVLLLRLSQIYWEQENYIEAARTYSACAGVLDKEHEMYDTVQLRGKVLSELEPHLSAVKLQDSLQALAKMDEAGRNAAIDRVIEALKKKEKEEEKKQLEAQDQERNPQDRNNTQGNSPQDAQKNNRTNPQQKGAWYFYNPATVAQGKKEFQKKWGKRKNEDNWRYSNREGLMDTAADDEQAAADSIPEGSTSTTGDKADATALKEEEEQAKADSLANDPHHREYYLKQIPFTEEQLEASNAELAEGLYRSGILEQEKLENFPLARRTLERLVSQFPEAEEMDNVYYHLFLVCGRMKDTQAADYYRQLLVDSFPQSKLAHVVGNPKYETLALHGTHLEDSLYASAYQHYMASAYDSVESSYQQYMQDFGSGRHHARMMFVRAMSNLYAGRRDTFMVALKDVISKYPKEAITEMAQAIVKGLEEGRPLMDSRYDTGDIWSRRSAMAEGDSAQTVQLTDERYGNFAFVLAYPTYSLDEDQLMFEMARFNFTSFMVRNFDIETSQLQGITLMSIKGFQSYDEAHSYAQQLYADTHMAGVLEGIRSLIISEENLKLVGTTFSFDDYRDFYQQKLAPIEVPEDLIIDEPTDIEFVDPEEVDENSENPEEEENGTPEGEDDFPFGF